MFKRIVKWFLITALITTVAYAPTTDTPVGRIPLAHPDLGHDGGAGLHTKVRDAWTLLSDEMGTRLKEESAIADATTQTITHNLGAVYTELCIKVYTGSGATLTRVQHTLDPAGTGYRVVDQTSNIAFGIKTPDADGPHTFAVAVVNGECINVDVLTTLPEEGQALVWNSATDEFIPGASGDSSFKLQACTTPNLTVKPGKLQAKKYDGKQHSDITMATKGGGATAEADFTGTDLVINLDTVFGGSPAASTTYTIAIDRKQVMDKTPTITSDTSRQYYPVIEADFVALATAQDEIDAHRYEIIGSVKSTAGSAWCESFDTGGFRRAAGPIDQKAKITALTSTTVTITGGPIHLPNGVAAFFGTSPQNSEIVATLTAIENGTATPVVNTTYYIYIDQIDAMDNMGATSLKYYAEVDAAQLYMSTSPPGAVHSRYYPIGFIRSGPTDFGDSTGFGDTGNDLQGTTDRKVNKDYIQGQPHDFEANGPSGTTLGGWIQYDEGTASPTACTGGTPTTTFVSSNTASITKRGNRAMLINKSATNSLGEGVSYDIAIDGRDQTAQLILDMTWSVGTGYIGNSYGLYAYDVTNAVFLPISGGNNLPNGDGQVSKIIDTAGTATLRLCIHQQDTDATAYFAGADNVRLRPLDETNVGVTASPLAYTLSQAVGTVGSAGQIAAGHLVSNTDFPSGTAYAWWDLTDILEQSTNDNCTAAACDFNNEGTVVFTATDIFGTASSVAQFNGTSQQLHDTDTFYDFAGGDFTVFVWAKSDDVPVGTETILSTAFSTTDQGMNLRLKTDETLLIDFADTTTTTTSFTTNIPIVSTAWNLILLRYDDSEETFEVFINGLPAGAVTDIGFPAVSAGFFQLGALFGISTDIQFYDGAMMGAGFDKRLWTDEEIAKLYSYKKDHNKNVPVTSQRWALDINNGFLENESDQGWLVDKELNSVYWDFSDLASTDIVSIKMLNDSLAPVNGVAGPGYSVKYSSDPGATINMGLPDVPSNVTIKHETTTANEWQYLIVDSFCTLALGTLVGCDFSALTISGARRLWIQANAGNAGAVSIGSADTNSAGVVSISAQTFAGDKTFNGTVNFPNQQDRVIVDYHMGGGTIDGNCDTINDLIDFEVKIIDQGCTGDCVTTGASWVFTAPRDGFYRFSTGVTATYNLLDPGDDFRINLFKNGSILRQLTRKEFDGTNDNLTTTLSGNSIIELTSGDTVDFRCDSTDGTNLYVTANQGVHVSINEISSIILDK